MVILLSYSCSCIFSFLYQFISVEETSFKYLHRRSKCDHCHVRLKWYELFPIFSFIMLKGRCQYCRYNISKSHLIGEVLAMLPIIFVLFNLTDVNALLFITTYIFLLIFSLTDIKTLFIDCRLIIVYCLVTLSLSTIFPAAFLIVSISAHIFYFLFKSYIGYGDILLVSTISLFFPLQFTIYLILFTFIIAGLIAIIIMIIKPIKVMPLVPFLTISFVINAVFYNEIHRFLGGIYY
ncbi:prepilin peptidase [Staphylococcus schweitzeri]|uniref:prepilin peptidase n=1 Tax=Staphylococcus schweitzeri TaxID=1654388 RepID=UPI000503C8C4|nr:A24 family peptidase [Staphylococcus schweitzeri]CDR50459.1 type III leader peptidase family protein [Staphylococcus schweitzeri]